MSDRTIHRVFGSLLAIWIGYVFNQNYPPFTFWSVLYLIFVLAILATFAVSMEIVFSRDDQAGRILGYSLLLIGAIGAPFAIYLWGTSEHVFGPAIEETDFLWRLVFIAFVFLGWFAAAEFGMVKMGNKRKGK